MVLMRLEKFVMIELALPIISNAITGLVLSRKKYATSGTTASTGAMSGKNNVRWGNRKARRHPLKLVMEYRLEQYKEPTGVNARVLSFIPDT